MTTLKWFTTSPPWLSNPSIKRELLSTVPSDKTHLVTLSELIEKSSKFPIKFPIDTPRCHYLLQQNISKETLEKNINSTYPIIHEHALFLCALFLTHQKQFGNKNFYKTMSLIDLIDRLLSKRAASFLGIHDYFLLLDGSSGTGGWENVGTVKETFPLVLENCLSYDEMKLSAFLSISSHSCFINDGNRMNCGVFEKDRLKLEDDGVIVGLIGTRLHKPKVMEYREIIKREDQNNHENGYGNTLVPTLQGKILNFYGDTNVTYDQFLKKLGKSQERYVELMHGIHFDKLIYCRRISLSIDTFLIEANNRAKECNKMAYVHVVGLGLGVWKIYQGQDKLFMDTFAERLELLSDILTHISDICFAYIRYKMAGKYKHGDQLKNIKLHMVDKKGPHVRLTEEDEGKLLVVSFAWDSNALPGNEFWCETLHTSSDPAAACSTQVAELHNWHINSMVRAKNLRVATLKGLVTFQEYQKMYM